MDGADDLGWTVKGGKGLSTIPVEDDATGLGNLVTTRYVLLDRDNGIFFKPLLNSHLFDQLFLSFRDQLAIWHLGVADSLLVHRVDNT